MQLPLEGIDLQAAVKTFERDLIYQALDQADWNHAEAAKLLRMPCSVLQKKLKLCPR